MWDIRTYVLFSVLSQCREAAREYIGGLDGLRRFFARHENVFKISGDRRVQKLTNPTIQNVSWIVKIRLTPKIGPKWSISDIRNPVLLCF